MPGTEYKDLPLVPAVCACGHKGKSKRPEYYQCGHCYYEARASWNDATVAKLKARIAKLKAEAAEFRKKSRRFRERHPVLEGPDTRS